jgi:hypothetical protein
MSKSNKVESTVSPPDSAEYVMSAVAPAAVNRLRLCVNHKDRALVLVQGASKRSYKPFAHAFGGSANRRAALIVESVNSHVHMLKTLRAVQRMAQLPASDSDRQRKRLALIARHVTTALAQVEVKR